MTASNHCKSGLLSNTPLSFLNNVCSPTLVKNRVDIRFAQFDVDSTLPGNFSIFAAGSAVPVKHWWSPRVPAMLLVVVMT